MNKRVLELAGQIEGQLTAAKRLREYYEQFLDESKRAESTANAIVIADLLVNYYTCVETAFLRIAQSFENNIGQERWHQTLLEKMAIEIPKVRPAVITALTSQLLVELLKFRHFKRYYFSLDYDWEKLRYLQSVFDRIFGRVERELGLFKEGLLKL